MPVPGYQGVPGAGVCLAPPLLSARAVDHFVSGLSRVVHLYVSEGSH